jgi:ribosomal protein S12 methylthiotransferase accessory factor YcaO
MKPKATPDPNRVFLEEGHLLDEAVQQGVRDALDRHAKLGQPVVIYRNGKIEWVPAEELLTGQPSMVAERPDPEYGEDK